MLSKDLIILCNIKVFTWFPCWLYRKHIEAYSGTPGYKALLWVKIPQGFEKHVLNKQMLEHVVVRQIIVTQKSIYFFLICHIILNKQLYILKILKSWVRNKHLQSYNINVFKTYLRTI